MTDTAVNASLADVLQRLARDISPECATRPEFLRNLFLAAGRLDVQDYRRLIAMRFGGAYIVAAKDPPENWSPELKSAYESMVAMQAVRDE